MLVLVLWLSASLLLAAVWALVGWLLGKRDLPRICRRSRRDALTRESAGALEGAQGDPTPAAAGRSDGPPAE